MPKAPPKSSKLDPHRDLLFRLWKSGVLVAEIKRVLKKQGCSASDTTIKTWFTWRVEAGELPPREPRAGQAVPAVKALMAQPRSLGILDPTGDIA